jgi:N,N'-diacetyllegionaminate synthase
METMKIGTKSVGEGCSPYIIAEIGSNHNGDMALCRRLIDSAATCGADAVKFQSWSKSSLISKGEFRRNTSYADKKRHFGSLEEMVERYQLKDEQHVEMRDYCRMRGIEFLSSAFSPREVELLETLQVPAHKLASMDITHHVLLEAVAATKKPVMLSTGMASLAEIDDAIGVLERHGSGPIILLHCVSIYPPEPEDIRLRNIPMLRDAFSLAVGFSDHTIGTAIPLASVALGACVIEKHFTLEKNMKGWDHWISADPGELKALVQASRTVSLALGGTRRIVSPAEVEKRRAFRRGVVVSRAKRRGDPLRREDLDFKRPGTGIAPNELRYVVGRTLRCDVEADHELQWSDLL